MCNQARTYYFCLFVSFSIEQRGGKQWKDGEEGLKRSLQFLEKSGVTVGCLVTDRHPQIQKYIREEKPAVTHYYDVWHLSLGELDKLQYIVNMNNTHRCKLSAADVLFLRGHILALSTQAPASRQYSTLHMSTCFRLAYNSTPLSALSYALKLPT